MNCKKAEQERKEGQLYRVAVESLRERWARDYRQSADIPDPKEPRTLFPNLVAEMSVSGYSFRTFSDHANVAPEIILDVIQQGEDLFTSEAFPLANLLSCKPGYLFSRHMQMVDPATNKGKARLRMLVDLAEQLGDYESIYKTRTQGVIKNLQAGRCITYAKYRWAYMDIAENLTRKKRKEESRQTRNERITEGGDNCITIFTR